MPKKFFYHDEEYGDQEEYTTEANAVNKAKSRIADGTTSGPIYIYKLIGIVGEEKPKLKDVKYTVVK